MGGSHSTSNQTVNVKQVINNTSDLTAIKDNVNKSVINTITNNSSQCNATSQTNLSASTNIGNITGGSGIDIGGSNQTTNATLNLSCVDVVRDQNDIANNIANAFANQISTKFDNNAMAQLTANANNQSKSGFLSVTPSSANTNVNENYNIHINNNINQTMKDIIKNETDRNFTATTLAQRIAILQSTQRANTTVGNITDVTNLKVGNSNQTSTSDLLLKAISEDSSINNTIDAISNHLNNISTTGVTTALKASVTSTATTKSTSQGLNQLVSSVFKGIDSIFGSLTNFLIVAVIGVVIVIGIFFFTGGNETLQKGIDEYGKTSGNNVLQNGMKTGVSQNRIDKNNQDLQNLVSTFNQTIGTNVLQNEMQNNPALQQLITANQPALHQLVSTLASTTPPTKIEGGTFGFEKNGYLFY